MSMFRNIITALAGEIRGRLMVTLWRGTQMIILSSSLLSIHFAAYKTGFKQYKEQESHLLVF